MRRMTIGLALLTVVAAFVAISAVVFDFTPTHLYNPAWPPHARFHGYLSVARTVLIMLIVVTLAWGPVRRGECQSWGILALLLLGWLAIWFLAPLAVPGTIERVDLWFAGALAPVSLLGLWLCRPRTPR